MSGVGSVGAGGYSALVQQAASRRTTNLTGAGEAGGIQSQTAFKMEAPASLQHAERIAGGPSVGAPTIPASSGIDRMLSSVTETQARADKMVIDLASGRDVNMHNTMVELEKADIALKYTVQLRNRALSAYEELMRMQI